MVTAQLNVRVPRDLKKIAWYVARMRGDSLSEVIRGALEDYIAQSDEEIRELARRIDEKAK